jgi:uncharacterized repeat protein (TIGR03803 family)
MIMGMGGRSFFVLVRQGDLTCFGALWRGLILLAAITAAGMAPWQGAHAAQFEALHEFCAKTDCADGEYPNGPLIMDGSGNLYGATQRGGTEGDGVVFELTPNAQTGKWTGTVLYSYCIKSNCTDGQFPEAGPRNKKSGDSGCSQRCSSGHHEGNAAAVTIS